MQFEAYREVVEKLNTEEESIKDTGDQSKSRRSSAPSLPPDDRCKPE
jgi:hypothetical protein